jgi:hypothetical protein
MGDYYVLEGHTPVKVDLMTWAQWFEVSQTDDRRRVAWTEIGKAEAEVSTVFLGLDHSFGRGQPELFETMVFGGPNDGYSRRYGTWDEAEAGHAAAVARAEAARL